MNRRMVQFLAALLSRLVTGGLHRFGELKTKKMHGLSIVAHVLLAVAHLSDHASSTPRSSCSVAILDPTDTSACFYFDFSSLHLPANSQGWDIQDNSTYHTVYEVAPPCSLASIAPCVNTDVAPSPAYALIGPQGPGNSTCYALGAAPSSPGVLPPSTRATLMARGPDGLPTGVSLEISGGQGGRTLIYNLICDRTAPPDQGPASMAWSHSLPLTYPVVWRHRAGCGVRHDGAQCPAPPKPPIPTSAQLAYQDAEIVAIVCFQMDTYAGNDGDPGCNKANWNTGINTSSPAVFNPTQLNVSQWIDVVEAMGAKYAWLTAKHGCGFLLWPTNTTLPDGSPYGYDVGAPECPTHVDIVRVWMDELRLRGIGPGLYYSLKDNFYLNSAAGGLVGKGPLLPGQRKVTQAEFEALELAQLTELWSGYGSLAETWFDGGWAPDMLPSLKALITKLLPNTAAFGGVGVTPNAVKWVGTEEPGTLRGPTWSTGPTGQGDPNSEVFVPAGCDTVMLTPHHWFMGPPSQVRSLASLIDAYHASVGSNCVLELGMAVDRTGLVPTAQVERATEFGKWVKDCYGHPVAAITSAPAGATVVMLQLPTSTKIDRVSIGEDLQYGQLVRAYTVEVQTSGDARGEWVVFSSGTSIGHKKIDIVKTSLTVTAVRLNITASVAQPHIKLLATFAPCPTQ